MKFTIDSPNQPLNHGVLRKTIIMSTGKTNQNPLMKWLIIDRWPIYQPAFMTLKVWIMKKILFVKSPGLSSILNISAGNLLFITLFSFRSCKSLGASQNKNLNWYFEPLIYTDYYSILKVIWLLKDVPLYVSTMNCRYMSFRPTGEILLFGQGYDASCPYDSHVEIDSGCMARHYIIEKIPVFSFLFQVACPVKCRR